jgi:predicted AAA+ superfamily ATPase
VVGTAGLHEKEAYQIRETAFHRHVKLLFFKQPGRPVPYLVYLHLRKVYKEIYYFSNKRECDFVVFNKAAIQEVVQVCFDLNSDNLDRERAKRLAAFGA